MRLIAILVIFVFLPNAFAERILIRDGKRNTTSDETSIRSGSSTDGLSMRKDRRVAIGFSAAGPLGVLGANLELNFNPRWGIMGGYGTGFTYQTWMFQVKRVLAGEYLLPYLAGGVARWYTTTPSNGPVTRDAQPAYLEKFLNNREKETGEFSQLLIYPAFGLQYMQLNGDYAGLSVFAEVVMLLDIGDFEAALTATVGMLYYF